MLGTLQMRWLMSGATFVAIGMVLLAVVLLYRKITSIGWMSKLLLVGVLVTMGWIIFAGFTHFNAARAFSFPPGAFTLSHNFFLGLGSAMLIATYDYWGYYNVCFLGDEVKDPGKTIPRALLLSILLVGCLYVLMNISILGVVPWQEMTHTGQSNRGLYVVSIFMQRIYGPWAANLVTALVMWTAFASVFSLLLGYSRVPYAAALDGNYFQAFARVHPQHRFPYVSLLALGGGGSAVLFFRAGGRDRRAGGNSHYPAVSGAGNWFDRAAHPAAGYAASISHVALSAAGFTGIGRIYLRAGLAHQLSEASPLCIGDSDHGHCHLHGASMAKSGVAVRRRCAGARSDVTSPLIYADQRPNIPATRDAWHPQTGSSALAPLREPLFRSLWIAAVISYTGTWMQNVGAGWLMTQLTMSPLMVSLVHSRHDVSGVSGDPARRRAGGHG